MDRQPHRSDSDGHDWALSAWMATESFTAFMTAIFAAAVRHADQPRTRSLLDRSAGRPGREPAGMTRPVFVVVCGINGAGKSTLADALAASPELAALPAFNPDRLSAYYRQVDPTLARETADIRALRHVAEETARLLAGRHSFISETVGANVAYRRYVEIARAAGFRVRIVFVGLGSAEQSVARVALRVGKGGHSIPEPDIRRRWPAVHANLTWFAAHADMLDVYANADDGIAPRIIARVRAGRVEQLDRAALPPVTAALNALL